MPYSCRKDDYKSAYKMGVSTTKELCGMCLESVMQVQDKNRRRGGGKQWHSSMSSSVCDSYTRHQYLCGCSTDSTTNNANKKGSQQRHGCSQHKGNTTAILNAAEAIVDSVCAGGGVVGSGLGSASTTTSDYNKVDNHHRSSGHHRQRHRHSPGASDNNKSSTTSRIEAITTMVGGGGDQNKGSKQKRQHSKHPSQQTQTTKYNVTKATGCYSSNKRRSPSSHDRTADKSTNDYDEILSTSGTQDTEAATKEPYTTNSQPPNKSVNQSQEGRSSNRIGDLSKHRTKKKGATDSQSESHKSLFDDNSSAGVSMLSSQEDIYNASTNTDSMATEANRMSAKRINRFLHNLSKEKVITDLQANNPYSSRIQEAPSDLPPLKFDSQSRSGTPREQDATTSSGESRDDDPRYANQTDPERQSQPPSSSCSYHSSGPIPISSRIHHFGKSQGDDDNALIDKNETSKSRENLTSLNVSVGENSESDDEDDDSDDDITGPRLAASGTLETLDTAMTERDCIDAHDEANVAAPSPSHSTATPMFSNIRTTVDKHIRNRVPTPRHLPPDQQPLSPTSVKKERKELYVVKEKLQWTKNKLESTQYELSVLKGIKDLYQRELECKALECKLAQWRLSHKPLAIDTSQAPLMATDDVQSTDARTENETTTELTPKSAVGAPDEQQNFANIGALASFASLSPKTCNEPTASEDFLDSKATNVANSNDEKKKSASTVGYQHLIPKTMLGCMVVLVSLLVWKQLHAFLMMMLISYQKRGGILSEKISDQLLSKGKVLKESTVLLRSMAWEKITSYLHIGKRILALLYWVVRGGVWWVLDIDINDWAVSVEKKATGLINWLAHCVLMFSRGPETPSSTLNSLDTPA